MQRANLIALLLLVGCFDEPSYEGLLCDEGSPCPAGYRCDDGMCTERSPGDDAGAGADAAGPADAGPVTDSGGGDAGEPPDGGTARDGGPGDTGPEDGGPPPDGGSMDRCADPVGYPQVGWEVRHFQLDPGLTFGACVGVEDIGTDDIDRDFGAAAPIPSAPLDFGSRYTATRTFEAGVHTFSITQDDGVRIFVDGQLVYENWMHGYLPGNVAWSTYLTAGQHQITVEHFDDEGSALLQVSRQRGCQNLPAPANAWTVSYHALDPNTLTTDEAHCYGFETVAAATLAFNGDPSVVTQHGITDDYTILARTERTFPGLTALSFVYDDGLRATIDGNSAVPASEWARGNERTWTDYRYLAPSLPRRLEVEKFSSGGTNVLDVSWQSRCNEAAQVNTSQWYARYYRVLYTASPESWTLDYNDCLGTEIINGSFLMQSGEPGPVQVVGVTGLWGAVYEGTRSFGGTTTVNMTYDDGIRLFNGFATPAYEDWIAPNVASGSVNFAAGTHPFRVEYFQNFGGTQCQVSW